MRRRGCRLVAAGSVVLLALTAGCASADPWAAEAEMWIAGFNEALYEPEYGRAAYYSEGTRFALVACGTFEISGRWDLVEGDRESLGEQTRLVPSQLFLDTTGFVEPLASRFASGEVFGSLKHSEIRPDGLTLRADYPAAALIRTSASDRALCDEGQRQADAIARAYVEAWNASEPGALASLYQPQARLVDSLDGIAVHGSDAISAVGEWAGGLQMRTLRELFDASILDGADRPVAAQQPAVDESGRVSVERRFHEVDAERACVRPADVKPGWWTGRDEPPPLTDRVTATIEATGGTIEVRNGNEALHALLRRSLARFTQAGLSTPPVASVLFDPFDPRCEKYGGFADWSDGRTRILVCWDGQAIYWRGPLDMMPPPATEVLILHELSHAWLVEYLTPAREAQFLCLVGAQRWNEDSDAWPRRGVEIAAGTMAWGLVVEEPGSSLDYLPPCPEVERAFRLLTGVPPLRRCPDQPGSP